MSQMPPTNRERLCSHTEPRAHARLRFETATAADISSIASLWIKANHARRERQSEEDADEIQDLIRRRMRESDGSFLVVKDAERVVGVGHHLPARENDGASQEIVPGLMHLSMVAVDPAHWGLGIGKAITSHCIERATELGYQAMQLWTHASNARSQRLYASLGFRYAEREKTDDHGERIQLYRRTLVR